MSGERWTFWRYVWVKTGEVTRSWVIDEPPPAEAGPDGDGFELQVVEAMPVADHQDALGEVEKDRDRAREACIDVEAAATRRYEEVRAAEEKLESLRSGLKAEVERLRDEEKRLLSYRHPVKPKNWEGIEGVAHGLRDAAEHAEALLDASEDTEKPCANCNGSGGSTVMGVCGFCGGWRGALNRAMEIGQAQGVSLAVLHDYLDGGDGHSRTPDYTVHWDGKPTAEERAALDEVVKAAYKKMSGEDTEKPGFSDDDLVQSYRDMDTEKQSGGGEG